jgi:hypothetical protein
MRLLHVLAQCRAESVRVAERVWEHPDLVNNERACRAVPAGLIVGADALDLLRGERGGLFPLSPKCNKVSLRRLAPRPSGRSSIPPTSGWRGALSENRFYDRGTPYVAQSSTT